MVGRDASVRGASVERGLEVVGAHTLESESERAAEFIRDESGVEAAPACGIRGQVRMDGRPSSAACSRRCATCSNTAARLRGTLDGVGLGIQRLRVIDLETGDQPIYNEDGTVAVVLNGEIYNFRELREELRRRGPPLRDRRRHRGDRPPLRGARRRLRRAPARDVRLRALGRAPAAVCCSPATASARSRSSTRSADGALSFASELQALLQDPDVPREVDLAAHRRLPRLRLRAGAAHALRGVRKLPPGRTSSSAEDGGPDRAVLAARYAPQAADVAASRARASASATQSARRGAAADDRRRPARRLPLRRRSTRRPSSPRWPSLRASRSRRSRSASTTSDYNELPYARLVAEQFGDRPHGAGRRARRRSSSCRSSCGTTASPSRTPPRCRASTSPR